MMMAAELPVFLEFLDQHLKIQYMYRVKYKSFYKVLGFSLRENVS